MKHNCYPDFKAGVGVLSREGDGWQLMEKRGSSRQMRLWGGKEGKEKRGLGKCDKVTSCSAAARLQHIWKASVSWKILQEIKEEGRWERREEWWKRGARWLTSLLFHSITVFKLCVLLRPRHRASPVFLPLFTPLPSLPSLLASSESSCRSFRGLFFQFCLLLPRSF